MKYNPDHHYNVVRNLKQGFIARYEKELTLPDNRIWQIFEEEFAVQSDDPNDKEKPIYEALKDDLEDPSP